MGITLITCKRDSDKATPEPSTNPRILRMRLERIPDNNVRIDQEKHEITITLPDNYTIRRPQVVFTLTPNSRVLSKIGESYEAALINFDFGNLRANTPLVGVAAESSAQKLSANEVVEYKIKIVQPGKLAIRLIPEAGFNTYTIGDRDGFILVGENFYDGSDNTAQLILTRKGGSEGDRFIISSSEREQYIVDAGVTNTQYPVQIRVRLPDNVTLLPGEYTLELKKANDRSAVSPDLLVVKKGSITLGNFPNYIIPQCSLNGNEVTIEGLNLFEDSKLEVELKHLDGTILRRKPLRFNRSGTALTFAPGADAKPGHYMMRVLENGQAASTCYRLAVTKTDDQPYITSFGNSNSKTYLPSNDFCNPENPLYIIRNAADGGRFQLFLQTAPMSGGNVLTSLKLVSVGQSRQVVEMPFQVEVYNRAVLDHFTAYFQFPTSVPAGQYRMSVVVTDKSTNRTSESEPFERVIEVR